MRTGIIEKRLPLNKTAFFVECLYFIDFIILCEPCHSEENLFLI